MFIHNFLIDYQFCFEEKEKKKAASFTEKGRKKASFSQMECVEKAKFKLKVLSAFGFAQSV